MSGYCFKRRSEGRPVSEGDSKPVSQRMGVMMKFTKTDCIIGGAVVANLG